MIDQHQYSLYRRQEIVVCYMCLLMKYTLKDTVV